MQLLLDRLESAVSPPLPDETRFYGWQPLPLIDFYRGLDVIGPGAGRSFLDVGSGIGSKLSLASQSGFAPEGIERHAAYVQTSLGLFPDLPVTLGTADAFDRYDAFDVVYCYRPCVDPNEQTRLNHLISDRMRPGALFFSAGGPYPDWLTLLGDQVWRV